MSVGSPLTAHTLLRVWERGAGSMGSTEEALMLCVPEPGGPPRTLGERNASFLRIHEHLFGRQLDLVSHCPTCRTAVQFACDCQALLRQMTSTDYASCHVLHAQEHAIEFRLPVHADIVHASVSEDVDDFSWRLLDRCVLSCSRRGVAVSPSELPAPVLSALSERLEALDPGACLSFSLECPECSGKWGASIDLALVLWHKVRSAAEQLLLDIDALARVYGWTEREVLRLSPLRRAAYVQLATG